MPPGPNHGDRRKPRDLGSPVEILERQTMAGTVLEVTRLGYVVRCADGVDRHRLAHEVRPRGTRVVSIIKTMDVACDGVDPETNEGCLAWEHGVSGRAEVTAARARRVAASRGWVRREGRDLCPVHAP